MGLEACRNLIMAGKFSAFDEYEPEFELQHKVYNAGLHFFYKPYIFFKDIGDSH